MTTTIAVSVIVIYFLVLISISFLTSKKATNDSFFTGNKQSPWYVVAFGMIGASLSGVTFLSVTGKVAKDGMHYMQMALGYVVGYIVIAQILLPLYYKLNLTSIYTYLKERFGNAAYKTGSSFFLISRIIGASFRLYLVAFVFQEILNLPFLAIIAITILLIWVYTFKGGIKTIIWTDTLQTALMLLSAIVTIFYISNNLESTSIVETVKNSNFSKMFEFSDWSSGYYFFNMFISGAFIAIVMTGLDQDMMQKNLSCKNLKDAQKNMNWFSIVLVFVNLMFLVLGVLLYEYGIEHQIISVNNGVANAISDNSLIKADRVFAFLSMHETTPLMIGILFLLGLIAAAYSSADSALTSLTTAFCVDILEIENKPEQDQKNIRIKVHIMMSAILFVVIYIFQLIHDDSIINKLFKFAGYTYGPLLGLYAFGLFNKRNATDNLIPFVAIGAPILSFLIDYSLSTYLEFNLRFFVLLVNGAITYLGLYFISERKLA